MRYFPYFVPSTCYCGTNCMCQFYLITRYMWCPSNLVVVIRSDWERKRQQKCTYLEMVNGHLQVCRARFIRSYTHISLEVEVIWHIIFFSLEISTIRGRDEGGYLSFMFSFFHIGICYHFLSIMYFTKSACNFLSSIKRFVI